MERLVYVMNCKECGSDHNLFKSTIQHQSVRNVSNHNIQPKRSSPYIHPWQSSKRVGYHTIQSQKQKKETVGSYYAIRIHADRETLEYFASSTLRTQILKVITNLGLRNGKAPKFLFALGPEMCSTCPVGDNVTEAGMLNPLAPDFFF